MKQFTSPIVVGNDFRENREEGPDIVGGKVTVVNYNSDIPIVHLTESQIEFLEEGNVIPNIDGTYYFIPYVLKQLGDSNLFELHLLDKIDMAKVGYTKEMLNELKSSVSNKDWGIE